LAFAALLILLACAGAVYEGVAETRDARRFPQRGKSVDAGLVKLNLDCSGEGSPTVILEADSGIPAIGWSKVQPEVARFTRVCSYDRAGYGWSEPGPDPRTSLQMAHELKALLDAAGEKGPYVLAGNVFGGFNVRVFTGLYPADVVGIVLVDADHEDEEERFASLLPPAQQAELKAQDKASQERHERRVRFLAPILTHLGILRLGLAAGWSAAPVLPPHLPADLVGEFLYLERQTKAIEAEAAEEGAFSLSAAQVRAAGKLGDRPLIVLTAGRDDDMGPDNTDGQDDDDPADGPPFQTAERKLWIEVLQVEEAHLSTRGRQIVLPDSGPMIPFQRPDAVISAIHEVWSAAR
jgi:pimeloyl-ACP methyl ester carboxylesterase